MKKQVLALSCGLIAAASILAGCSSNLKQAPTTAAATEAPTTAAPATEAATTEAAKSEAGGALSTGFSVLTSIGKSTDAGEKDGLAEVDTMFAAVLVDDSGKIVDCKIDCIQSKVNFSKEGKVLTDLATVVETKNELGEKYGMKKASSISKEWNEQAEGFAQYVIGKTADEVKGIAVSADGLADDADLKATITVHIGDFIQVVEQAVANAKSVGAQAGDKLGYGIVTGIAKSADATAEKAGVAQAYSTYTVASFGADGKITSCVLDASQSNVNFDTTGKITSDLKSTDFKTKNQLGEAYGMKKASAIGKEWNEQAASFAAYAVGKTASEITGLAIDEAEGAPTDADLKASVTVGIGDFQSGIAKAEANAK
ncbi:MAG: hypothetical protein QM657_12485 [Lacrimispora sp.]|uniref:hypothetical protein n=1 Tax=Lacrimispora sp. TaxID=2719234 RepID=UPI0039E28219